MRPLSPAFLPPKQPVSFLGLTVGKHRKATTNRFATRVYLKVTVNGLKRQPERRPGWDHKSTALSFIIPCPHPSTASVLLDLLISISRPICVITRSPSLTPPHPLFFSFSFFWGKALTPFIFSLFHFFFFFFYYSYGTCSLSSCQDVH